MINYKKIYINVIARFDENGGIMPIIVDWQDGRRFYVDKVVKVINAPPRFVGGSLTRRYDVIISGAKKSLYFEYLENRWFVESFANI